MVMKIGFAAAQRATRFGLLFLTPAFSTAAVSAAGPALDSHVSSFLPLLLVAALFLILGSLLQRLHHRLKATEERLELVTQGAEAGVIDIDLLKGTAYVSPSLRTLVAPGSPSTAEPLSAWKHYLPTELVRENLALFESKIAAGLAEYDHEFVIYRPDGQRRVFTLYVRIDREKGQAVRVRGTCVDVTERKVMDAQLSQTHDRVNQQLHDFHQLHELSNHLLETAELEHQLEAILRTLAKLHGADLGLISLYDPRAERLQVGARLGMGDEMSARLSSLRSGPCARVMGTQERVIIENIADDRPSTECREIFEQLGVHAVHATPLTCPQGVILGTITIFLKEPAHLTRRESALADICARKAVLFVEQAQAKKELIASRGRFEAVLEASGVPFAVLHPVRENGTTVDFRWSYLNRAAARTLSRSPTALMGRRVLATLSEISAEHPEFRHCVEALETRTTVQFTAAGGHGRKTRWFHCVVSPIDDDVVVWFNDISERIRAEQLLHQGEQRKDEFLATLAHELRSLLAPVRQAVKLLACAQTPDAQRQWACDVSDRQVQRMALLLEDLMDVPRITRGTLVLKKAFINIEEIVVSAIETARPNIDAKEHRLTVHDSAVPIVLHADLLRLTQVVANLLNNAAKYTAPGGAIDITVRREQEGAVIEVRDNGVGIPPEAIPEVFGMFAQLNGGDEGGGGLGIGLALSKSLVELHDGNLTAYSEGPGRGSVFTVRLPLACSDEAQLPRPPSEDPPQPCHQPFKVLIADDNRDAVDTLAALLALEGHETHRAYDGDQAMTAWQESRPNVCLLDIGMPGRTGYEIAREIRSQPDGQQTLLVAVSGWGQAQDRQASLDAGFNLHLTKPVSPEQITLLLHTHARLHHEPSVPLTHRDS